MTDDWAPEFEPVTTVADAPVTLAPVATVPTDWAPDGSGVFLIEDEHLVFDSVDGPVAAIAGLGVIRSVVTRSATN